MARVPETKHEKDLFIRMCREERRSLNNTFGKTTRNRACEKFKDLRSTLKDKFHICTECRPD